MVWNSAHHRRQCQIINILRGNRPLCLCQFFIIPSNLTDQPSHFVPPAIKTLQNNKVYIPLRTKTSLHARIDRTGPAVHCQTSNSSINANIRKYNNQHKSLCMGKSNQTAPQRRNWLSFVNRGVKSGMIKRCSIGIHRISGCLWAIWLGKLQTRHCSKHFPSILLLWKQGLYEIKRQQNQKDMDLLVFQHQMISGMRGKKWTGSTSGVILLNCRKRKPSWNPKLSL